MSTFRHVFLIFFCVQIRFIQCSDGSDCTDLIDNCSDLANICSESILAYNLDQLSGISEQLNSSSIPDLSDGTTIKSVISSTGTSLSDDEKLQESLPLLKESLPLIRESLPLLRESLPLIRQILNPLSDKTTCQKKTVCKSCKTCPEIRDSIVAFVEALCPSTCKICTASLATSTTKLVSFFI